MASFILCIIRFSKQEVKIESNGVVIFNKKAIDLESPGCRARKKLCPPWDIHIWITMIAALSRGNNAIRLL